MKRNTLIYSVAFALSAMMSDQALAQMSGEELISFCAKPDIEVNQRTSIGAGKSIMLVQGSMMTVETDAPAPTKELIASELATLQVHNDCIEYLMDKGIADETLGRVYFDFDKSSLTPASKQVLQGLMDKINLVESNLLLSGHTDSIGTKEYNYALGLRRAESVQGYLMDKGVDRTAMILETQGEDQPIAGNNTVQGREKNRRVELVATPEVQQ
ncbi:OmpA family protein [Vibrio astriarenae]